MFAFICMHGIDFSLCKRKLDLCCSGYGAAHVGSDAPGCRTRGSEHGRCLLHLFWQPDGNVDRLCLSKISDIQQSLAFC